MKKTILFLLLLISFILAGCAQQNPADNRVNSDKIVWKSVALGDEEPDKSDAKSVCEQIQTENNMDNCSLLLFGKSINEADCVDGMSVAGCVFCKFDCSNQPVIDKNAIQKSSTCTYYEYNGEEGEIYTDAACNQLMISFKYGYVSNQVKDEIEKLIYSYGGKIISKDQELEVWLAEIKPKDKLYELKNIINEKDNISAGFNVIAGLD